MTRFKRHTKFQNLNCSLNAAIYYSAKTSKTIYFATVDLSIFFRVSYVVVCMHHCGSNGSSRWYEWHTHAFSLSLSLSLSCSLFPVSFSLSLFLYCIFHFFSFSITLSLSTVSFSYFIVLLTLSFSLIFSLYLHPYYVGAHFF